MFKKVLDLGKAAVSGWVDDFAPSMGAALAYYTMFSIAPLLLIVIAVAALVFGHDAAQNAIMEQLRGLLGQEGASAVETMLKNASQPKSGIIAGVIGIGTLILGATTVLAELESALDRIWGVVRDRGDSGIWNFIRTRVLSMGMIFGVGFLLLVSLVVSAGLGAWGGYISAQFPGAGVLLKVANFVLSFLVLTLLFAALYKFLPSRRLRWRDVWVGAAVTALLFTVGRYLIGLYIGASGVASGYGAAGAFIVLLVWIYYSAQIFLLGAEFTKAYAQGQGSVRSVARIIRRDSMPKAGS